MHARIKSDVSIEQDHWETREERVRAQMRTWGVLVQREQGIFIYKQVVLMKLLKGRFTQN